MFNKKDRVELFDHYCSHLGKVKKNWNLKDVPKEELRILGFSSAAAIADAQICTFGLSDHPLKTVANDKSYRVEYMISTGAATDVGKIASLLLAISEHTIKRGVFPGVHNVLGGNGPVLYGGNPVFEHFYLTRPIDLARDFAICLSVEPPIEIVQLVPISTKERKFIESNGWESFEKLLLEEHKNLLLFDGRSVVIQ